MCDCITKKLRLSLTTWHCGQVFSIMGLGWPKPWEWICLSGTEKSHVFVYSCLDITASMAVNRHYQTGKTVSVLPWNICLAIGKCYFDWKQVRVHHGEYIWMQSNQFKNFIWLIQTWRSGHCMTMIHWDKKKMWMLLTSLVWSTRECN